MASLIYAALGISVVFFIYVTVMKFMKHSHMTKSFTEMKIPNELAYLSASTEIKVGAALIEGFWKPAYAGLGATIMVFTLIGASIANSIGKDVKTGIGVFVIFCIPMI